MSVRKLIYLRKVASRAQQQAGHRVNSLRLIGLAIVAVISLVACFPAGGALGRILGLYQELRQQDRLLAVRERQVAEYEHNKNLVDGFTRPKVAAGGEVAQMLVEAEKLAQAHGLEEKAFEMTSHETSTASGGLKLLRAEFEATLTGTYTDTFNFLLALANGERYFQIETLRMTSEGDAPGVNLEISYSVFSANEPRPAEPDDRAVQEELPANPFSYDGDN